MTTNLEFLFSKLMTCCSRLCACRNVANLMVVWINSFFVLYDTVACIQDLLLIIYLEDTLVPRKPADA